jgi:hypothetical protein
MRMTIEAAQPQPTQSSNDLEEFKDVFVTQEDTQIFDDSTLADVDKKKKPIIKRRIRL